MPTADYWATLLWKRLMGGRVLGIDGDDTPGRTLRGYAHCAAAKGDGGGGGGGSGVALAMVNLAASAVSIDLHVRDAVATQGQQPRREVYLLGTVEGVFTGNRTTLNGRELLLSGTALPPMPPVVQEQGLFSMPPLSVAFVVLPDAHADACSP